MVKQFDAYKKFGLTKRKKNTGREFGVKLSKSKTWLEE